VPHHPKADNSTYGNTDEIHTTHWHVDWEINFDTRMIDGFVIHDLEVVADNVAVLTLDAWNINVISC